MFLLDRDFSIFPEASAALPVMDQFLNPFVRGIMNELLHEVKCG